MIGEVELRPSEGRVLVTGGSRGIGRAVVEALVARGAKVAAVGRDGAALGALRDAMPEGSVIPLVADVALDADRDGIVPRAVEALGGLDALVQCAGIVRYATVGRITAEDLRAQIAVNLVAPLLIAQAAAPHLRSGGAIVHVTSNLGSRPVPGTAAYAATKAALDNVTRTLAQELAPFGIRVNAVAPGVVDTEMIRVVRSDLDVVPPTDTDAEGRIEAQLQRLAGLHPLGRIGRPAEIAEAVIHLLDAPWTTGAIYVVDGGRIVAD
jgi:NAD(P)-dependent dehydrogenase (short-subunit alcohol dehydrogenase family)